MRFRRAYYTDVFNIIQLYQKGRVSEDHDHLFLDYRRVEQSIKNESSLWFLMEIDGKVVGAIYIMCELGQRLAKLSHMLIDPTIPQSRILLRELLDYTLDTLENDMNEIDVIYTTTLTMSLALQNITLEAGFKVLGVFPNVDGEDQTKMNGLTAKFFRNVLTEHRSQNFQIHEKVQPFFEISRKQCGLDSLPQANMVTEFSDFGSLPPLEMVRATNFVTHRFNRLKKSQSQVMDFYPFYNPESMVTDADEKVQVYIARPKQNREFAAIIGEYIETSINPIDLYNEVQNILRKDGVSYIEIINDASDTLGLEYIMRAGFTPCAYFPAFKKLGTKRRDYVVFGKSFEYLCRPSIELNPAYTAFYHEYFKIEGRNYLPEKTYKLLWEEKNFESSQHQ